MTKKQQILEKYWSNNNFNRKEFAHELNVDEAYIRKVIRGSKKKTINQGEKPLEEKQEFNRTSQNRATLTLESLTITTLEQALEVSNVDMTQWKVDRYTIGSWQVTLKMKRVVGKDAKGNPITEDYPKTVTMYKIQVWLVKLHNMEWVEAIRNLIKEVPKIKTPKRIEPFIEENDRYLLEVALFDVHFGMLAWDKETPHDYDLDITEKLFLYAVQDLLNKSAGYKPSRIIFPFGNDFLHIDDPTNLTPQNRNPLDVDSRLIKIYQKAKLAVIKAIDYCRQVAPVDVVWIPGNHDPNVSYYLCDVISEVFADDEHVTVDVGPKWRKFYPWGDSLLAFTHGVEEPLRDLPSIIATEEPQLWGNSKYREIHIGHKHRKQEMRWVNVDTHAGTVVRMIPSIATEDAWHYRKGYIKGYHAAESYIWDKNFGVIGQFTSYIDYPSMVDE
jgi:hypothetical protein